MPDDGAIFCPIPQPLTHDSARNMHKQVRKDMPGLTDAAYRREAARRLNVDYDSYLAAWKKPKVVVNPDIRPVPLDDIKPFVRPLPEPVPQPLKPTLTHDSARAQWKSVKRENPSWTDAMARREAAKRMDVDYDEYLTAWKKGPAVPKPVVKPKPEFHAPDNKPLKPPTPEIKPKVSAPTSKTPTPVRTWKLKEDTSASVSGVPDVVFKETPLRTEVFINGQKIGSFKGEVGNLRLLVDGVPRLLHASSQAEAREIFSTYARTRHLPDRYEANPGFQAVRGTTANCPSTTTSWELRQRGYDVHALKMPNGAMNYDINDAWGIRGMDHVGARGDLKNSTYKHSQPLGISQEYFLEEMESMPDGARGFISVTWKSTKSGHIFNWERRNGKTVFIDAQPGIEFDDPHRYFSKAENVVNAQRVDRLNPTADDLDWLTESKGPSPIKAIRDKQSQSKGARGYR